MSVRRALRLAPLLLAGVAAARAESPGSPLDELLARLGATQHRHATFTERFSSHLLDRAVDSSGELFYDAPDHLEKRTLAPRAERMVLDHGALTLERRTRSIQTTLAAAPDVAPFVEAIRATLAGDRAALEHYFEVELERDAGGWSLVLVPRAVLASKVAEIRIRGAADEITGVAIRLANGDASLMTLTPAGPG